MKILFMVNHKLKKNDGITNKIYNQISAIKKNSNKVYLSYIDENENSESFRVIDGNKIKSLGVGKLHTHFKSMTCFDGIYDFIKGNNIEFLYIRYSSFCNPMFINLLKKVKKIGCKIYIEIPTYPYDKEIKNNLIDKSKLTSGYFYVWISIERITRRYLHKYVDRVITFTNEDSIFGIESIQINNAASENCNVSKSYLDGKIRFIGVASLSYWHGYDRFIMSVSNYVKFNNKVEINFDIVGDSPLRKKLEGIVKQEKLEEYVKFHGALQGDELDIVFKNASIGIDSLGRHRSGNNENNSLKSKEYLMRGIPVVKSHIDRSVDSSKFHFTVSADEKLFEIEEIINWYNASKFKNNEIREYALNNYTWEYQFKKVFSIDG